MTVQRLIESLRNFPPDFIVLLDTGEIFDADAIVSVCRTCDIVTGELNYIVLDSTHATKVYTAAP